MPGPGEYEVVLDTETLPDDVPGVVADTITTTVNPLQDKAVLFRVGEPGGDGDGEGGTTPGTPAEGSADTAQASQIWQLVASGLRFGLILGLAALGLSLVFGTTGLTNFAHGELVTFGATRRLVAQQRRAATHRCRACWPSCWAGCSAGRRTSGSGGRCASADPAWSR